MSGIILHHYDTSPFSEKVRLMLGIKGLSWRSVIQPVIMPKPELTPLTGGYRRIPVMQIGADVFCDSQAILAEIDRRFPTADMAQPMDWAVNFWADRAWFQASVAVIFADIGADVPKAFIEDREKLSGRPFDMAAMQAAAPIMRAQWRAFAAWVEAGLADREFLGGARPSLADIACWMNVWWTWTAAAAQREPLFAGLPRLADWRERLAAIGHGQRNELSPGAALDIAKAASPEVYAVEPDGTGLTAGDPVSVQADDYGRDAIEGVLAGLSPDRIVVARRTETLGDINVHFPRAGYVLARR